ncbi:Multidrug resistance protein MdtL [ANME-1 cluster archaeon GoMg1]|nr:Multidrug resistance protein MdtL [ANME-1 cluster archaeon GoMg1]
MKKGSREAGAVKSSSMGWGALIVIYMASFILVFDTTAMTVAINDLVVDLHTTVGTIQAVMAIYTLVMASMMLMGAKLCDMYGRKKVFLIGTCIYGVGTATAALSPNVAVLLSGWSVIEGIAAAGMMPANMALLASTYADPRNRATAFAIYGGIIAGGAALGPLLGGLIISALSWRAVFAMELIRVVIILAGSRVLKEVEIDALKKPHMDIIGVIISAVSFFFNHSRILNLERRISSFISPVHVSVRHHPVRVFQIMDRPKKKGE